MHVRWLQARGRGSASGEHVATQRAGVPSSARAARPIWLTIDGSERSRAYACGAISTSSVCLRNGEGRYTDRVPTVHRDGPYRFFFYSADRNEPVPVHVERDANRAKFWLDPVRLARSGGFAAAELREVERVVVANQQLLLGKWNEYFSGTE
jgi:hypothetical protein